MEPVPERIKRYVLRMQLDLPDVFSEPL